MTSGAKAVSEPIPDSRQELRQDALACEPATDEGRADLRDAI
jgi:hypothetical protein